MSLRIRRGGGPSTTPEPPPTPGAAYTFPTTTFRYPHFPCDEGHTSHASCNAASGGNPTADGMICVTDYGATGNGTTDDTAAIQSAIEQNMNESEGVGNKKTLYFPDGTYRLTGLSGNVRGILERRLAGEWRAGLRIQGESEAGTILKLDNNVFNNATAPRFVIFLASARAFPTSNVPHYSNDGTGLAGYHHHIQDITINLGVGNAGAIGINAGMHNTSEIRRVTIDGRGLGAGNFPTYAYCGISAERQGVGPGMWERITVKGCQYGVRIGQSMCGHCIEHLKLENQGIVGVYLNTNGLAIRGLTSTSTKPVVQVVGAEQDHFAETSTLQALDLPHTGGVPYPSNDTYPAFTLIDAEITGTASSVSAISNQASNGKMFLRNINTTGYARAADDDGTAVTGGNTITEYATLPNQNLWGETPVSLNLPIVNTPERPYPAISQITLANITNSGQPPGARIDVTAQFQTAIDTCTTDTLYIPSNRGRFFFYGNTPVIIRGNVRHIIAHGSRFYIDASRTQPMFRIDTVGSGPPVIIEGLRVEPQSPVVISMNEGFNINTPRDVVFQDCSLVSITNTSLATGRVFINNCLNPGVSFDYPQDVWARMFNCDGAFGVTKWTGGKIWILYYKSEYGSRAVQNITGGSYEEIGSWHSLVSNPDPGVPLYTFSNCDYSLDGCFTHEGAWAGGGTWATLISETQGGTTRTVTRAGNTTGESGRAPAPRGGGRHLTLVRSRL